MNSRSGRIRSGAAVAALLLASCSGSVPASSTTSSTIGHAENEHDRFIVSCLNEFGISAETLADKYPDADLREGGVFIPDNYQREAVSAALAECQKAAVEAELERDFQDPDVLRSVYWELVDLYECLTENGYPATDPPSEQVFVESNGWWHPTYALGMNVQAIKEAAETCPAEGFGVLDLNELGLGE